jgi:5-methylcytosine-specific restriction endonuclease McrA
VDHIVPVCDGGKTEFRNLALCCQGCNNCKSTKTVTVSPLTGRVVRLFHPRKHRWRDHFAWSRDFTTIEGRTEIGRATVEGRTEIGRATVEVLRLNRDGLVNIRRALALVGAHPPGEDE